MSSPKRPERPDILAPASPAKAIDEDDTPNFDAWIPDSGGSGMGSSPSSAHGQRSFGFNMDVGTPSSPPFPLSASHEASMNDGQHELRSSADDKLQGADTPGNLAEASSRFGSSFAMSPSAELSFDQGDRLSHKGATLLSDTLSISGSVQDSRSPFNRDSASPRLEQLEPTVEHPGDTVPSVMDLNVRLASEGSHADSRSRLEAPEGDDALASIKPPPEVQSEPHTQTSQLEESAKNLEASAEPQGVVSDPGNPSTLPERVSEADEDEEEDADELMAIASSFQRPQAKQVAKPANVPWKADGSLTKKEVEDESESGDVDDLLMSRLGLSRGPSVGIGGVTGQVTAHDMMRDLGMSISESDKSLEKSLEPPSAEASGSSKTPKRNPLARGPGKGLRLGQLGGSMSSESDEALGSLGKERSGSLASVMQRVTGVTGKLGRQVPSFGALNLDDLRQSSW